MSQEVGRGMAGGKMGQLLSRSWAENTLNFVCMYVCMYGRRGNREEKRELAATSKEQLRTPQPVTCQNKNHREITDRKDEAQSRYGLTRQI